MTQFKCPHCGRTLLEYELKGSLWIKIRCRKCSRWVEIRVGESPAEEKRILTLPALCKP